MVSVSTDKAKWWDAATELKVGGSRLPFVVKDGRYLSKGKLSFYVMHDPTKCITLRLNNEVYSTIVFQVQNKRAAAKKILSKIKG